MNTEVYKHKQVEYSVILQWFAGQKQVSGLQLFLPTSPLNLGKCPQ